MPAVILLARIVLSGVFLVAGLSKLKDRPGSRQSLIDFGLPRVLAPPFAILLPAAELIVAIAILPASFAWLGAIGALALLAIFIVAILAALAGGKKPDCHCFGQLHSKPVSWSLVARNVALSAAAVITIYAGPRQPSFITYFKETSQSSGGSVVLIIGVAVLAILALQYWLIFQLVQQGGRILLRFDELEKRIGGAAPAEEPAPQGLAVGEPAPEFELPALDGAPVSLQQLRSPSKPVVLLFTHPACGPCTDLLPEAAAWHRDYVSYFNLAVLTQGTPEENRTKLDEYRFNTVLVQREHEISDQYDALATPSAVLVRPDGAIGTHVATGAEAIRSLVSTTINESLGALVSIDAIEAAAATAAPPLVFPDLDGKMVNLTQIRGKPTVTLFWNPGCGYCQQMVDDLKAWEKKLAKAGKEVVLISTGTVDANRNHGFRSRILIDHNFTAGKAFRVDGTPSAILLDECGKIASKVAVGKQDIIDLIFNAPVRAESRS